jgi:hypothetical protein
VEKYLLDCPATRPVSVLLIYGTADSVHPYSGYPEGDFSPRPAPETFSFWARHNSCSTDSVVTDIPDVDAADSSTVKLIEYGDCQDSEVLFYAIEDGGHSWPGRPGQTSSRAGNTNMDIDATALIWDFFVRNPHPLNVGTVHDHVPANYRFSPAYPNPFSRTTTITITLARSAEATLSVFELLGGQIRVLASGTQPAGSCEVSFDAGGLPSGVYFYRLEAGSFTEAKRMVVVS